MDYFTDVLTTFLGLGTFQLHCYLMEGQKALRFHLIKNILIFVEKINEGLTGLERHEGHNFHFWVNYPFKTICKHVNCTENKNYVEF